MLVNLGILLAPALLILLACRGWNIALAAFCAAGVAALLDAGSPQSSIRLFAAGFTAFAGSWCMLFIAGAGFGAAMRTSGIAGKIAMLALKKLGRRNALLATLLIALLLSYGGLGTFIIAFVMYPIADTLFRQAGLPRKLLPAALLFCPTTLAMTMLPGSPSVQNLLPTAYIGTTIYAAPFVGLATAVIVFLAGYAYLASRGKTGREDGEAGAKDGNNSYEKGPGHNPEARWVIFLPLASVWAVSWLGHQWGLDSKNAVTMGLALVALACAAWEKDWRQVKNTACAGVKNGLAALLLVSAIMGFGAVVKATAGYGLLTGWIENFTTTPLAAAAVLINIIAAVTGSSAASLEIFLNSHAGSLLASGLHPEFIHRFLAIASSGLDSMPYATGIVVTLQLSGISLKDAYPHIFATCALLPLLATGGLLLWAHF